MTYLIIVRTKRELYMMCLAYCNHSIVIIIETEKYTETTQQSPVSTMGDTSESPFLMWRRNILYAFKGAGCRKTQNPVRQTGLSHSSTTPCLALGKSLYFHGPQFPHLPKRVVIPHGVARRLRNTEWDVPGLRMITGSPEAPVLCQIPTPVPCLDTATPQKAGSRFPCPRSPSRERRPVGRASGLQTAESESLGLPVWSTVSL